MGHTSGQLLTPKFNTGNGRLFVGDGDDYPDIVNFNEVDGLVGYKTDPVSGGISFIVGGINAIKQRGDERLADVYSASLIASPSRPVSAAAMAGRIYKVASGALLLCTTTGTTGANDPSITAGVIADGTAAFYYLGRTSRVASSLDVPVITIEAGIGAGLTERRFSVGSDTKYAHPGGTVFAYGATAIQTAMIQLANSVDYGMGATGRVSTVGIYEFFSDAPKIAFTFDAHGWPLYIDVDGHPIEESPTPIAAGSTPSAYVVDWSARRKMRRYTCRFHGNTPFRGVSVSPQDTVIAAPQRGGTLLWFGDSYASSEVPNVNNSCMDGAHSGIGQRVGRLLGMSRTLTANIGGTGYDLPTGAGVIGDVVSLTDFEIVKSGKSIVIYAGGYNDFVNSRPVSAVVSAAQSAWASGVAKYPLERHVVIGPWPAASGPSAACLALDTALAAAAADAGLEYVSPAAAVDGAWISGTGKVNATTGNGNSDFYTSTDGTHASPLGQEYIAKRIVDYLKTM